MWSTQSYVFSESIFSMNMLFLFPSHCRYKGAQDSWVEYRCNSPDPEERWILFVQMEQMQSKWGGSCLWISASFSVFVFLRCWPKSKPPPPAPCSLCCHGALRRHLDALLQGPGRREAGSAASCTQPYGCQLSGSAQGPFRFWGHRGEAGLRKVWFNWGGRQGSVGSEESCAMPYDLSHEHLRFKLRKVNGNFMFIFNVWIQMQNWI